MPAPDASARSPAAALSPRARVLTELAELEHIRAEWEALWERSPCSTPFHAPAWIVAWWRHLGGGALRVIELRRAGRLVGMAPLFVHALDDGRRRLAFVGDGISDMGGALLEGGMERAGARLILATIAARRAEWELCELRELRGGDPLLAVPLPEELGGAAEPVSVAPWLPLAGSFEDMLPDMSPSHRRKLHQAENRIQRAGGARFTVARDAEWRAMLGALFRLHERRWRERGESGVLADARVRAMHLEVAPAMLARGYLRLFTLHVGERLAAVLYGFACHERLYCYLQGIDPAASHCSPGVALLRRVIEHAIGEGVREIELLRGAEAYKYRWGARDRRQYDFTCCAASPRSR
ncbi:MAG TPA: GNAT family N-acetyltransferase [Gemmatimonadaceae bacterium]|nr:GNAT family N-acetyltransferase [Gemmatimonadaceae bacterium]